jgi:hypothetical protein
LPRILRDFAAIIRIIVDRGSNLTIPGLRQESAQALDVATFFLGRTGQGRAERQRIQEFFGFKAKQFSD